MNLIIKSLHLMKTRKTTNMLLALFVLLLGASCKGDDSDSKRQDIDTVNYLEKLAGWNWNKMEPEQLYVIRSIDEYNQYMNVGNSSLPEIDFKKHSLLVAKGQANRGISGISGKMISSEEKDYTLSVEIKLNDAAVMGEWYMGELTLAVPADNKVKLNIIYQE